MANVAEGLQWLRVWNDVWGEIWMNDIYGYQTALDTVAKSGTSSGVCDEFMCALVEVFDELLVE